MQISIMGKQIMLRSNYTTPCIKNTIQYQATLQVQEPRQEHIKGHENWALFSLTLYNSNFQIVTFFENIVNMLPIKQGTFTRTRIYFIQITSMKYLTRKLIIFEINEPSLFYYACFIRSYVKICLLLLKIRMFLNIVDHFLRKKSIFKIDDFNFLVIGNP